MLTHFNGGWGRFVLLAAALFFFKEKQMSGKIVCYFSEIGIEIRDFVTQEGGCETNGWLVKNRAEIGILRLMEGERCQLGQRIHHHDRKVTWEQFWWISGLYLV